MYANAVVNVHEDFDIVDFAETFFDTDHQCLIVREKGSTPHWHVHGTWKGDRKAYKEYEHKGRVKLPSGHWSRPVRVSFDKDAKGFQYCCKADPPNVVRKWHITDEQISEWHEKSDEHNEGNRESLSWALADQRNVPWSEDPGEYYRACKRFAYTYQWERGKNIHPAQMRSHLVTHVWSAAMAGDIEHYKRWVLDNH